MQKLLFPFLLLGTIAMIILMNKTGKPLKTASTPLGILNLEFAYDTSHVNKTINAWKLSTSNTINKIDDAKTNTWWDFLFIFLYSTLLFVWCKKISNIYTAGTGFEKIGKKIAYLALIAGGLDVIENCCMFQSLNGNVQNVFALMATICASVKFIFVIITVFYILFSLPIAAYAKLRQ